MNTGFKDLDEVIKVNKGDLIVVASRPAMGKSTFALNILSHLTLEEKNSVLFFSLEDSKENIINKLIISDSMVEAEKFELYNRYKNNEIQKPNLSEDDWDRIAYGINLLKDAPIYIESDAPYSIEDICIKSTRFKKEKNIEAIIIDYLQLIQFKKKKTLSWDEEVTEILRKLKVLAKILDIPVIITSQLSGECEKRDDKRPTIEDFTNSKKAIVTYSDKILFLYRDSYYNKENKSDITDVIIAKNNDGAIDTIKVAWMPEYCMFGNAMIIENTYPTIEVQPNERYLKNAKLPKNRK